MTAPDLDGATARLSTVTGVPGVDHLLSDDALSALLGRAVTIKHLRMKPGRSVVVSWCADATGDWGWAEVTGDEDKADKAILRSEVAGESVHSVQRGTAYLLWGGFRTDRALAKDLLAARDSVGADKAWEVLRYNPSKRVVARLGDSGGTSVLRVSPETDRLVAASQLWQDLGAPVLVPTTVGRRGTASLSPWWGTGDLLSHPDRAAALEAGRAVGGVHRASLGKRWPGEAPSLPNLEVTASGLIEVAPWLTTKISRLVARLEPLLGELAEVEPVWVHGDLSPDQVLHDGAGGIRIIDLDRAGSGPAAQDVGSWLAACAAAGRGELVDPFMSGYAETMRPSARGLAAAQALAQFRAAVDPFRKLWPDWPAAVTARIALTEQALRRVP